MHKDITPVEYLQIVLNDWQEFCNTHQPFAKSIKAVIDENNQLKQQLSTYKRMQEHNIPSFDDFKKSIVRDFAERIYHIEGPITLYKLNQIIVQMIGEPYDIQAFIQGTELALDYNLPVPDEDIELYYKLTKGAEPNA